MSDQETIAELRADLTAARADIAKYQARLEIDHWYRMNGDEEMIREEIPAEERDSIPDGIAARDETIKILEKQIDAARADIERLTAGILDIESAANSFCDESGDEVAGQIRLRCRALLDGEQADRKAT